MVVTTSSEVTMTVEDMIDHEQKRGRDSLAHIAQTASFQHQYDLFAVVDLASEGF